MTQPVHLKLELNVGPNTDLEARSELARQLRRQLTELETDRVELIGAGSSPPGAKGDPVLLHLAVTLGPTVVTGVIQAIQAWLLRHKNTTITVESGAEKLILTGDISEEQRELIDSFLKHTRAGSGGE